MFFLKWFMLGGLLGHTLLFRKPQERKSSGVKSHKRGGQDLWEISRPSNFCGIESVVGPALCGIELTPLPETCSPSCVQFFQQVLHVTRHCTEGPKPQFYG